MGILEDKIKKFLSFGSGYGSSDGSSYGYGSSDGSGSGYGSSDGSGYGYGSGSGSGSGFGDGSGYGYGSGFGLKSFENKTVYIIDDIQTIITHVSKNIAKGFILEKTFILQPCYIAKGHNLFAHRSNIKKSNAGFTSKDIQEHGY